MDYPLHANIGDLLIHLGEESFFVEHGFEVAGRFTYHDYVRPSSLGADDVFIFSGGGNVGDLYPEHRLFLEQIVRDNMNNRVMVFPQTVHFVNKRTQEETCKLLSSHPSLTFYVRDAASRELLISGGVSNVLMMPDMAHQLAGHFGQIPSATNSSPNYIFRKDVEAQRDRIDLRHSVASPVDWGDSIGFSNKILVEIFYRTAKAVGPAFLKPPMRNAWFRLRDRLIDDGKRLILRAPVTYTDRLHVMIFSLLLGRQVHVFDNSYGKVRGYYDAWLKENPLVRFESTGAFRRDLQTQVNSPNS